MMLKKNILVNINKIFKICEKTRERIKMWEK